VVEGGVGKEKGALRGNLAMFICEPLSPGKTRLGNPVGLFHIRQLL